MSKQLIGASSTLMQRLQPVPVGMNFDLAKEPLSREISKIPEDSARFESHPRRPKAGRSKAQPVGQSRLSEAV